MAARKLIILACLAAAGLLGGCDNSWKVEQANLHYAQSQLLAGGGDEDQALIELAKAIEFNPKLSLAYTSAGDIHRKRGHYLQAVESYKSACEVNSYAFRPHYNLGVTYQILSEKAQDAKEIQDYQNKAKNVYLRAVTIIPEDFDANLNLSACYFQLGKYDMAEAYCKAAISANPENPKAYGNLGIIYNAQDKLFEAVKAYKTSLELDTNQPKILLDLGATYLKQGPSPLGRVKSALRVYELAAEKAPEDPEPHKQIGLCYYRLKQYTQAIEAYKKALELDGDNSQAFRGLGTVYMTQFVLDPMQTQYKDQGIEAWNCSLENDPYQDDLVELLKKYSSQTVNPKL